MTTSTETDILSPSSEGEGLHIRHGTRTRKASLSDGVAVERIGSLDRAELFEQATKDLNREIMERKSSEEVNGHHHHTE